MSEDDVDVQFGANIEGAIAGITEVKEAVEEFAAPINALMSSFKELSEVLVATFAVEKIAEFMEQFAQLGTETQKTMSMLGVSAEQVKTLDLMAQGSGSSLGALSMGMERFSLSLARAHSEASPFGTALKALGVSASEIAAMPMGERLELFADKFSVLKDGSDKTAISMALFGRAGMTLIPTFNQGADALKEFGEMAEKTNSAMSGPQLAAAHSVHEAVLENTAAWRGLYNALATELSPAFVGFEKVLTSMVEAFTKSANEGGAVSVVLGTMSIAARAVATAFAVAVGAIEMVWATAKAAVASMASLFGNLGNIIYSAFTLDLPGIKAAWANLTDALIVNVTNMGLESVAAVKTTASEIVGIWNTESEQEKKIVQDKTAHYKMADRSAVSSAMAAAQERIKLAGMEYQEATEKANAAVKLGQSTESQKTTILLAALNTRHNAELSALSDEAAIGGLSIAQKQKITNEKLNIDKKYEADRQKIVDQALETEVKGWTSAADQISGAFNSQLKGILAGTTSLKDAMGKMLGDLIIKLISDIDKWALEWVAKQLYMQMFGNTMKAQDLATTATTEAGKTAATTAGVAARTGAEAAGASAGILAQIGNAMSVITSDAAKTFAGVFAFLSPTMGPAAVGPAAASSATVQAAGAAAVLDVGTDLVRSSGLAFIHAGESVIPAAQTSGPYTGGGGGGPGAGGQTVNITVAPQVSAIDAQSVQQFFTTYAAQLGQTVSQAMTKNPSLRPAY